MATLKNIVESSWHWNSETVACSFFNRKTHEDLYN